MIVLVVGAVEFDLPDLDLAIGSRHVHVDEGVGIGPLEFANRPLHLDHLGAIVHGVGVVGERGRRLDEAEQHHARREGSEFHFEFPTILIQAWASRP